MKAKEAAHLFDQASAILKLFPDMELGKALSVIHQTLQETNLDSPQIHTQKISRGPRSASDSSPTSNRSNPQQEDNLIQHLDTIPTENLDEFIRTHSEWKKKNLQKIATLLGISFTEKATREQLHSLILSHYETRRSHSIIRTFQPASRS